MYRLCLYQFTHHIADQYLCRRRRRAVELYTKPVGSRIWRYIDRQRRSIRFAGADLQVPIAGGVPYAQLAAGDQQTGVALWRNFTAGHTLEIQVIVVEDIGAVVQQAVVQAVVAGPSEVAVVAYNHVIIAGFAVGAVNIITGTIVFEEIEGNYKGRIFGKSRIGDAGILRNPAE